MEKEDKHLDGSGLGKVWAKIKAQYLALAGGTLTGNVIFNNGCTIQWKDNVTPTPNAINILGYSSSNTLVIGYGHQTKGDTNIYGKVVNIMTNGNTARVTVNSDGTTTLANKLTVSSGGLEVTGDSRYHDSVVLDNNKGLIFKNTSNGNVTALSLNSQNVLAIGYGNASANQTQIFGKSIILATNGANTRMTIGEDGNISVNNNLAVSGAISEGGTLISTKYTYTEGSYVSITNNAISVKEASSSQGGVVTTGAQTIAGAKTFSDNMTLGGTLTMTGKLTITMSSASLLGLEVTSGKTQLSETLIKKSTSGTTPLIVATSYSTGENASRAAIEFEKNDGSPLGYIGCRLVDNVKQPYFYDSTYRTIWHAGNANLATVDWACNDLSVAGDLGVTGASTLASLGVTGNTTIGGTLGVTGATAMSGRITMTNSDGQIRFNPNTSSGSSYEEFAFGASSNRGYIWGYTYSGAYMTFKNGYVGVGKTISSPSSMLHVGGDITATGGVAAGGIADLTIY